MVKLRLITGGGGLTVDYVIKILIFTLLHNTNLTIFNSNSTQFNSDIDTIQELIGYPANDLVV